MSMKIGGCYPIAAREHVCDYCGDDIPRRQRYHRWAWVADGRVMTVRAHIACDAVAQDYYDDVGPDNDARWVQSEPVDLWLTQKPDPRGRLSALAARTPGWPDGEAERLMYWAGLAEVVEVAP